MIALDTNVLVRLLVQDNPHQFMAATALLEAASEAGEPCYLSDVVLAETIWVLRSRYGAGRSDLQTVLTQILADSRYLLDDPDTVTEALAAFAEGKAGFSDYLISARARRKGARATFTFDRKLKGHPGSTCLR